MKKYIIAVIHTGSSNIRLKLAEYDEKGKEILEELSNACPIGKDIYIHKNISRGTIDKSISIINSYLEHIKPYNVDEISLITSPTVLEAGNSDIFFDNIRMYTGYDITPLKETDETQYYYYSQGGELLTTSKKIKKKKIVKVGLLKIGGGSCLFTIFQASKIICNYSFRLGPIRLMNQYKESDLPNLKKSDYFTTLIGHELTGFKKLHPNINIDTFHVISDEFESVAEIFCGDSEIITKKQIKTAENEIENLGRDQIYYNYNIPIEFCDSILPTCVMVHSLMNFFKKETVHTAKSGLLAGFIELKRLHLSPQQITPFSRKQLHQECMQIGRHLSFDVNHAKMILKFSLKLFDTMKPIHKFSSRERLYLYAAALLHDIGSAISMKSHHRHSQYIIMANNFLLFSDNEKKLIAHIARYHRKSLPNKAHVEFNRLSSKERMIVLKCAAILRIMDALDYSHMQMIYDIQIHMHKKHIVIDALSTSQPYGEIYSFKIKKDLFETLFGITVELNIIKPKFSQKKPTNQD